MRSRGAVRCRKLINRNYVGDIYIATTGHLGAIPAFQTLRFLLGLRLRVGLGLGLGAGLQGREGSLPEVSGSDFAVLFKARLFYVVFCSALLFLVCFVSERTTRRHIVFLPDFVFTGVNCYRYCPYDVDKREEHRLFLRPRQYRYVPNGFFLLWVSLVAVGSSERTGRHVIPCLFATARRTLKGT